MALTRIPSSLVANTFTANTVLFANGLGYLSNTSNFKYFSGNNTIAVGAVVAGGIDVISYTQAAFSAANAAGSSAYVQSAYNQANTATGIAQAAFNSANNVAPQVQPAFNKANSANVLAQAAYDSSNAVNQYATSAYGVANTNATNITLVNQYAVSGYNQANTATGIAQAAFNSANNVAPQVQPAFDKANAANSLAQSAYNSSNAVNQYANSAYAFANTNNAAIVAVNQYAASAYYNGNLNATNITSVNQYAVSAYNTANSASANTIYHSGVNVTQNTNIASVTTTAGYAWDTANNAHLRLDVGAGTQATQNTRLDGIEGTNLTQNTRINSIETINTNQNTSISIIQGIDGTQNTRLDGIEGTNLTQNTSISIIQGVDVTQNTRLSGIEGVNDTQNTNITSVNQYAASAYNKANNALPLAGGTVTGTLLVGQDVYVSGNLYIGGNTTTVSTNNVTLNDSLIYLADQNPANTVDIGLVGHFVQGKYQHTGVVRNHLNGNWTFFSNVSTEPTTTINFAEANIIYDSITTGGVVTPSVTLNGKDLQSLEDTQNTNITLVNQFTQSAYNTANVTIGINDTQNTRIGSIETINTNQNTSISIIQGVDATQNTRLDGIEGINVTQNTNITYVNQYAASGYALANTNATNITYVNQFTQSAYNAANAAGSSSYVQAAFDRANTASSNTIIIQGVDAWQNSQITYINQFTQSAYNAANAAGSSSYVQAAFDKANTALANTTGTFAGSLTTTGNVRVTSTQAATSTTTGALTVSGGVGVSGNLYAGNIYTNGALINNSAALTVYKYVATAGQTTFSGTDVNSLTLSYVASAIFVTLNGVVLSNTLEYTATNGTSVVLGTAAELDDELNIYSFGAFQIADAYTSLQADSRFLTQANAITGYVSTANGTAINQFAAGAYTAANTAQTTATGANGLAAGAFNTANGANGLASGAFNKANNAVAQTGGSITGSLSVSQDLTVTGNLTVLGNSTTIATSTLDIGDSLIYLANNNLLTDSVDIGFIGHYNNSGNAHTGLVRDPNLKEWIFFTGYTPEVQSNNLINIAHPSFAYSNVYASFFKGNVISQGYELFSYSSAAFAKANTAYTNAVNGSNTSVQFASVGVGTAASGTYGEIRAINNITGYYSSDKKYKENVINIPDALNKVDAIGGKMFDWTDSYIQEHGGEDGYFVQKRDFGVIAQDVQAVFPEAVRTREDGSLAVDYSKLSALAFAAIVELKKEIEQLKNNK